MNGEASERVGAVAVALACVGLAAVVPSAGAQGTKAAPEVVVHVSDLPSSALYEFEVWDSPGSPGKKMLGVPNSGDNLDPPPENDPHVTFKVPVQPGVAYRCWVHMYVGKPMGVSQANLVYVQFTDAVDQAGKEILKPRTGDYLTLRGPTQEGWVWAGGDMADPKASARLVSFRASGEVTVRVQAGMEGVGFDQVLLSPARFVDKPPSEAVVAKPGR
jgi:hypothetical protein